ncbi:MAG: ATP-grasp fold amidoligase family protein [Acetobacteraceae bacterium]|nr:ATP-grasp fold amidoligase family protein [Acetobacteraceae bacterium]
MLPILLRRFRRNYGRWPNLIKPTTYHDKLFIRLAFDRRPVLQKMAGKVESRSYVCQRLGRDDMQATLLGVAYAVSDLASLDLPARYIAKGNHASELVRIVTQDDPITSAELEALVAAWLAKDYGRYSLEWVYLNVRPAVVFEELLDRDGAPPRDVKFYCFGGRVEYIQVQEDLHSDLTKSIFNRDRQWLDLSLGTIPRGATPDPLPKRLDAMIAVAQTLAAGMDYLRVDTLDLGDRFYVGELTTTPDGGSGQFTPPNWDAIFGAHWTLPPWRELRGGTVER